MSVSARQPPAGAFSISSALPAGTNVIGHVIVDSSGLPTGAATAANQTPTPTSGAAGSFTVTTAGAAVNIAPSGTTGVAGTSTPCSEVEVCCHLNSPGYLCVGWAAGDLRAAGSIQVYQGQSIKIKISNVNKLWADASASSSLGSWLAT